MNLVGISELITSIGFPTAMVVAFGWYITKKDAERNKVDEEIRKRMNDERDKLLNSLEENKKVNIEILATNRELAESNRVLINDLNIKMNTIENSLLEIKNCIK